MVRAGKEVGGLIAKMQSKFVWKELVRWWGSDGLC